MLMSFEERAAPAQPARGLVDKYVKDNPAQWHTRMSGGAGVQGTKGE